MFHQISIWSNFFATTTWAPISIAFWKGPNGTPLFFRKKSEKIGEMVKYLSFHHVAIYFHPTKKIHRACFVFRGVFRGGETAKQPTHIEWSPTPRNSTLRLHQRVGDVMPKLKVPSQPDVRCLRMWWKPGPDRRGDDVLFVFCFFLLGG